MFQGSIHLPEDSILFPAIIEMNLMHLFLDNIDQTRTLRISSTLSKDANDGIRS